ncbi:ATP-binding cassette domain-containing protein [Desulfopila aestuarii]|uniref:Monosaccharide ABC transporter ATP-binding protein, CUT2 family n=1 Tax=Desulfopila aestuarii DSM 18488 TaxID=1121416 RepID=A0A1M7XWE1_9BACT|nr:ATP-binding cassette domain-containing protein [Desulfopila aestuarii]SHO43072.1 monosaccharide ABC transporter ATP-binding protein, CUT2 family [Desulfopila aestuarii DSM 18488]
MDTILTAKSLYKSFGSIQALTDINLSIPKGQVVALIGDNGAGKSTIIKILSGVHRPDSGSLWINGNEVNMRSYSVRMARSLGVETVYQERSLGEKQPLWRNVFVGRHLRNALGFIRVKEEKDLTLAMLRNSIGLKGVGISADALVSTLSGGERQGLAISRAMHFNSALTILDEPTTALSVKEVGRVLDFIRSIPDRGNSALFISHNLHHVHEVADMFLFVARGTIAYQCRREEMSVAELFEQLETLSMAPYDHERTVA